MIVPVGVLAVSSRWASLPDKSTTPGSMSRALWRWWAEI